MATGKGKAQSEKMLPVYVNISKLPTAIGLSEIRNFIEENTQQATEGELSLYSMVVRTETRSDERGEIRHIRTMRTQLQISLTSLMKYMVQFMQEMFVDISGCSAISDTICQLMRPYANGFMETLQEMDIINRSNMSYVPLEILAALMKRLTPGAKYEILKRMDEKFPELRVIDLANGTYNGNYFAPSVEVTPALIRDLFNELGQSERRVLSAELYQQEH